tara:strand:+ start:18946 stop:20361 length:1416 start_codon:yes stop_codon:yes gene_type:complete
MSLINSTAIPSASGDYAIDNSLKFEPDNSECLKWTDISTYATSARKKTFSFSVWFKITELGVQRTIWANATNGYLLLQADGQLKWQQSYGGTIKTLNTNRLFRDTSAWYNVIIAVDSTQSTEANRVRLYVNGVEETSLTSTTYPSQNAEAENVYQDHHYLGAYTGNQIYWAGYMSNVAFISDAQITPSAVGEFDDDSGIWKPKAYSGGSAPSYFLQFKDSSDLGTATGLDADTLTNITATDQATDTPTLNYGTWNALFHATGANDGYPGGLLISEGATEAAGISGWDTALSTIAVSQGKWYAEFYITGSGTPVYTMIGAAQAERFDLVIASGGVYVGHSGSSGYSVSLYGQSGNVFPAQDDGGTANKFNAGDLISVALDMDNHKIYWRKNGTWLLSDDPASNNGYAIPWTGDTYFGVSQYDSDNSIQANFGGYHANTVSSGNADANGYGNFEYSVPSGYYALNTYNLNEHG